MYGQAAEVHTRQLGEHPDTALSMMGAANALEELGKVGEALAKCQEVFRIQEKVFGSDHPEVADTRYNIGNVYESQGLFELAAESFESCAAVYSRVHGDSHSETIDAQRRAEKARGHAEGH